jgi:regulator of protease activity HflC (stomatin/prohibitin superfamily)
MFILIIGALVAIALFVVLHFVLKTSSGLAIAGALAIFLSAFIFDCVTIIPAGHVGVQATFGQVNFEPLAEGLHFVNPLSTITNVDVRLEKAQLTGKSAGTKDLQVVHTDITVNYRLDPAKAPVILKDYGLNVSDKILDPSVNEAFKSVTGHYTSEELITKRDLVSAEILQHVKDKVHGYDIVVSSISLVNFAFSPEYQKAIEAKVISVQQTAKAEQDLRRIEVEAKSRIAQAEGEAKAIAIQAAAIQSNGGAQYVQLQALEKWNGVLPTMMSGAVPFINVTPPPAK